MKIKLFRSYLVLQLSLRKDSSGSYLQGDTVYADNPKSRGRPLILETYLGLSNYQLFGHLVFFLEFGPNMTYTGFILRTGS
jgi:hypothetical protein